MYLSMSTAIVACAITCLASVLVLAEFLLPGAYPRQLIGHLDVSGYPVDYPYGMAIAKGSSLDAEGGVAKKPRTVFTPKQLLHLEEQFVKTQFPNMEQRRKIAKDLDLTQQHIQVYTRTLGMYM